MMKRNRRRTIGLVVACGTAGAASPLGCTDFSDRVAPPVDCTVGDAYDIDGTLIGDFEGDDCTWYGVEDRTGTVDCDSPTALTGPENIHTEKVISLAAGGAGGATLVAEEIPTGLCDGPRYSQAISSCEEIPEGPRCGSEKALHLVGSRNNDWGGFFGNYAVAQSPLPVSNWDGLAFWARAEVGTERSFTIELDDKYTANVVDELEQLNPNFESACVNEEEQANNVSTNTSGVSQSSGEVAGWVPSADACDNPYQYHLSVTNDWELYLIPFDDFTQEPLPNRRIKGFDRESFRGLRIRMPKDTIVDLWVDDFGLYRNLD